MLGRSLLVALLGLALSGQAEAKKTGKAKSAAAKKSKKKSRQKVSRDLIREESMAQWPKFAEFNSRQPGKIGVPELDRLLLEHPPLGEPLAEDSDDDLGGRSTQRLASDSRDRGLSTLAIPSHGGDALERLRYVAEPFLGAPYRTGGESISGFDCSGFVRTMVRAFGQDLEGRSSPAFYTQGVPVAKDELQTGDLLFFSDHHRSIGHVAIYLAEGKFVHASVQRGVIVSDLDEKYYKTKYKGARRHEAFATALKSPDQH